MHIAFRQPDRKTPKLLITDEEWGVRFAKRSCLFAGILICLALQLEGVPEALLLVLAGLVLVFGILFGWLCNSIITMSDFWKGS